MTFKRVLFVLPLLAVPVLLSAQGKGLDPAELLKPLADSWTTYNGDYSGKRFSSLTQITRQTVKHLTLACRST